VKGGKCFEEPLAEARQVRSGNLLQGAQTYVAGDYRSQAPVVRPPKGARPSDGKLGRIHLGWSDRSQYLLHWFGNSNYVIPRAGHDHSGRGLLQ
jgi:hypothetical protein